MIREAQLIFYEFIKEYQKNNKKQKVVNSDKKEEEIKMTDEEIRKILRPLILCISVDHSKIFTILENYAKLPREMRDFLNDKLKKLMKEIKKDQNLITMIINNQLK